MSRIIQATLDLNELARHMAKEDFLHIRFSRGDKKRVEEVAKREHLDTSTWARRVILKAVEKAEDANGPGD